MNTTEGSVAEAPNGGAVERENSPNDYPSSAFLRDKNKSEESKVEAMVAFLSQEANKPKCGQRSKGMKNEASACSCLHDVFCGKDEQIRELAEYLVEFGQRHRDDQTRELRLMLGYIAMMNHENYGKKRYYVPVANKNYTQPFCQSAFMALFGIGTKKFSTLKGDAKPKEHGSKGKASNRSIKGDLKVKLDLFFNNLTAMGSPKAVRVRTKGTSTSETRMALPSQYSQRGVYSNFCDGLGWKVHTENDGNSTVTPKVENGPEPDVKPCSRTAFVRYWNTNYPNLIIAKSKK